MLSNFVKAASDKLAQIKEERSHKNLGHSENDEKEENADDDAQTPPIAKNALKMSTSSETPTQFLKKL